MNHVIHDFYLLDDVDYKGRTLRQMWGMTRDELEKSHDVIQWLFPLNELSMHNKRAPILDDETIQKMKENPLMESRIAGTAIVFLQFLGFYDDDVRNGGKPHWVNFRDHNYLRITRAIKSLKLFGVTAQPIYNFACEIYDRYPDQVGAVTKQFWDDAMGEK